MSSEKLLSVLPVLGDVFIYFRGEKNNLTLTLSLERLSRGCNEKIKDDILMSAALPAVPAAVFLRDVVLNIAPDVD